MKINIIAKGFDSNRDILNYLTGTTSKEAIHIVLRSIAEEIIFEARNNVQQNRSIDSGTLLASLRILAEDDRSITVGTDVNHAYYIEFGRGPVRPVNKKYLHWIDKDTSEDVFATYAGPTEPQPFLQPAVEKVARRFGDLITEANDVAISGMLKNDSKEF